MARLTSLGAELNTTSSNVEVSAGTISTMTTTAVVKSGVYAYIANPAGAARSFRYEFAAANTEDGYYLRAQVYVGAYPSAQAGIMGFADTGTSAYNHVSIRMNTDGTLELWNEEDNAQIGSDSSALSLNTWYLIELKVDCTTIASTAIEARIGGSSFASGTINLANGVRTVVFGITSAISATLYYDDIALNNDAGSFQNSWPGSSQISSLKPNADGDNSAWAALGSSNDYKDIDETTPDDSTSYISETTSGDITDVEIEDPVWLAHDATINVVHVGIRFAVSSTAGTQPTIVTRIKAAASGTVEEGSSITCNSTSYASNANAAPRNYSLTLYDLPGASTTAWSTADLKTTQIGVRLTNSPTGQPRVSTLWLMVDFVQGTGIYVANKTDASASNATSLTFAHVVDASVPNALLVVTTSQFDTTDADRVTSSITYNSDSLTQIANSVSDNGTSDGRSDIWYRAGPDTGSNNVVVTMGGTCTAIKACAITLGNAKQTSIPDTSGNTTATSASSVSQSVTTTVDNCLLLDAMNGNVGPMFMNSNQYSLMDQSGSTGRSSGRHTGTAGSHSASYNVAGTDDFTLSMAAFATFDGQAAGGVIARILQVRQAVNRATTY